MLNRLLAEHDVGSAHAPGFDTEIERVMALYYVAKLCGALGPNYSCLLRKRGKLASEKYEIHSRLTLQSCTSYDYAKSLELVQNYFFSCNCANIGELELVPSKIGTLTGSFSAGKLHRS